MKHQQVVHEEVPGDASASAAPFRAGKAAMPPRRAKGRKGRASSSDRFGISHRIAVFLTGTSLILLILAGSGAVLWRMYNNELAQASKHLLSTSRVLAAHANATMASAEVVLGTVAERVQAGLSAGPAGSGEPPDSRAGHEMLLAYAAGLPAIDALTIVGADGRVLASSRAFPPPKVDLSDREHFRALRDGLERGTVIKGPARSQVTGRWSLYAAQRLSAPDGSFAGIVTAVLALEAFEDFYGSLDLPDGTWITLDTTQGVLLARYPHVEAAVGSKREMLRAMLEKGDSGVLRGPAAISGKQRIAAYHKAQAYPLLVSVRQTERAALEAWHGQAALVGSLCLLAIMSIIVAVLFLVRRIDVVEQLAQAQLERQEALIARAAADAASQSTSQFLAGMSHELRTPLNAVIGFADVIGTEQFGPITPVRYREYARDIHRSGTHLLTLINDVLDFSRLEAGTLPLHEEEFELAGEIRLVEKMVSAQAEAGAVRLENLVAGDGLSLFADPGRVRQVLLNLLSNAIKFTPEGGRVTVSSQWEPGWFAIAVKDTGIGIAAPDIAKVLTRFGQVDSALARRHQGAGLGLPLSKGLMELHGGTLAVESQPGAGTTVTVRFSAERVTALMRRSVA